MAKAKSSIHGKQNKKIVTVHRYKKVRAYRRSTPN